jgi:hypothetical protein
MEPAVVKRTTNIKEAEVVEAAATREPPAPNCARHAPDESSITVDAGSAEKFERAKEKSADDRRARHC